MTQKKMTSPGLWTRVVIVLQAWVRALVGQIAARPWTVLVVTTLLTLLSLFAATRIELRTSFWDTMSEKEPSIARIRRLASNFPSAVTAMVVVEGADKQRLIQVAQELKAELIKNKAQVGQVFLDQPRDFFAQRALLYLPLDELRQIGLALNTHSDELKDLHQDPSLLALLQALEAMSSGLFSSGEAMTTVSARIFAKPLIDDILAGKPSAQIGVKLPKFDLAQRYDHESLKALQGVPVPPSNQRARLALDVVDQLLDLVADVLEQGEQLSPEIFAQRVNQLSEDKLFAGSGLPEIYQFSKDGHSLLMEVAAAQDVMAMENLEPFVGFVEQTLRTVGAENNDVKLGLTGMPAMIVQDQRAVLSNFVLVTILGLLGILAVFIIGFQQVGLPALSTIPLLMGVAWTLGLQGLLRPELNMFNMLFPVLLFGLGIDFAIHIISSFTAERSAGASAIESLSKTYDEVVPGLVVGALTTAAAFFVLMVASLKGVRELGLTAGTGVLMALLSMLIVLPALLVLWDRRQTYKGTQIPQVEFRAMDRLGAFLLRSRYAVLAGFLVVSLVLAYFIPKVKLEKDSTKMRPQGTQALLLQEQILKDFGMGTEPSVFFAKDLKEVERLRKAILASHTIAEPLAITQAIPSGQVQKAPVLQDMQTRIDQLMQAPREASPVYNSAQLDRLRQGLARLKRNALELSLLAATLYDDDIQDRVGRLRDHLNRIDARLNSLSAPRLQYLDRLLSGEVDAGFHLLSAMTQNQSVGVKDLPPELVDRLRGRDGEWMVVAKANGFVYDEDFLNAHVAELQSISQEVTGMIPVWQRMLQKIVADLPTLMWVTLLATALLVFLGLRSLRGTLLALAPLFVGMVWTLGIMGLVGLDFNVVSVLALPLIVGIGIDDGVHYYHRVRHDRDIVKALRHTGKPIILTSLTTGIGFGSLLLSVHGGVFALGLTTTLGIFVCLFVSLLLLPALIAIFQPALLEKDPRAASEPEDMVQL